VFIYFNSARRSQKPHPFPSLTNNSSSSSILCVLLLLNEDSPAQPPSQPNTATTATIKGAPILAPTMSHASPSSPLPSSPQNQPYSSQSRDHLT